MHWEAEKQHPAEVLADYSGKDRDIKTRDCAFERRKGWLDQEIAAREAAMLKLPGITGPTLDFDAACENLDLVRKYVDDARKWLDGISKQTKELEKLQDNAGQEMLDPSASGKIAPLKLRALPQEFSMKLILRHLEAYETKIGEIQNFVEELASDPEEMFERVDERCGALAKLARRLEGELQQRPEEKRIDAMEKAFAYARDVLEQVKQNITIAETNVEKAKAQQEKSLKVKAIVCSILLTFEYC
ncbi:hypothetical protein CYLTODRAFT_93442 [Cylindrobasidium torrendii FP15055 ss-10]|uniref:Uncharacterized protein n=1 Tax=Cylindrobasidium torrendii FP15055 ss-10 TaxID=1314674 RepID=A0A0D7BV98_9AGAR|nr:hypothetical protein CYLTODRAFT_93442 [Cylindrobasidium torrendii FP15055 ss-10]